MTDASAQLRSAWRGRALIGVAILHVLFVIMMGSTASSDPKYQPYVGTGAPWSGLHPGFDTELPPPLWLLVLVWSLFFGVTLGFVGALLHTMERRGVDVPRAWSASLLAFALAGGVLMPMSGFWFVVVIAAFLLKRP